MKFKELRGLFLSLILFILDVSLFIHSIIIADKMKIIISLLLIPIILINFLKQFYIHILSDSMLIYNYVGPFAVAMIIDFKDILDISLKNNYCIKIHTKKKAYPIYVLNAKNKYVLIKEKWEVYLNA